MKKEKYDVDLAPLCECEETHTTLVQAVIKSLPDEEEIYSLSDFFKVFGDPTRLNILFALEKQPMCGCDLAEILGISKAAVSYQLKALRQANLVRFTKRGKNVIYELSDRHVKEIIDRALEHIRE